MVCTRCKIAVRLLLDELGINYSSVELGQVDLTSISKIKREALMFSLKKINLELIDDQKKILVEKIKLAVIDFLEFSEHLSFRKKSSYFSSKIGLNYSYLARVFSIEMGMTLGHYIILQRVERVKELIIYDEHNLKEIAYLLNFSSLGHMSYQFKKITGLSPSLFRTIGYRGRIDLDKIGN